MDGVADSVDYQLHQILLGIEELYHRFDPCLKNCVRNWLRKGSACEPDSKVFKEWEKYTQENGKTALTLGSTSDVRVEI